MGIISRRKRQQKVTKELRRKGLCHYCRKNPRQDGKTSCRICREKNRKEYYQKKAKDEVRITNI